MKLRSVARGALWGTTGYYAYRSVVRPKIRAMEREVEASEVEADRVLPGDEVVPHPIHEVTNAITIQAPPELVWPWLVQMGYGRGGWYSYDRLDNGGMPSAQRILHEYQGIRPGEALPVGKKPDQIFPVLQVDPNRLLVLGGTSELPGGRQVDPDEMLPGGYWRGSRQFFLDKVGARTTRIITRTRVDYRPRALIWPFARLLMGPVLFLMQRKQLLNIRDRAERMWMPERVEPEMFPAEDVMSA